MRTLLVLIALVVLAVAAAMFLGLINVDQTRPAVVQAPSFKADIAKVSVGSKEKTVTVPTVDVQKPGNSQ